MAAAFAFLGIYLISLLVAEIAALSLGDFFGTNDEFAVVLGAVAAFTTFTAVVFAIVYGTVKRPRALGVAAMLLALLAIVAVAVPGLIGWIAAFSTNPFTVGDEEVPVALELVIPALLAV